MSLVEMTSKMLSQMIGEPVPDLYVTIAKNSVFSMDDETLIGLLGVTIDELREIQEDELYKKVRLLIAAEHAKGLVVTDTSWDSIEQQALTSLKERMPRIHDPDQLLKIAAMANRATRRVRGGGEKVLDPSQAAAKVPLVLTQRLVQKINDRTGERSVEQTRQISVLDGTAKNPTFDQIDEILGVTGKANQAIPAKMSIKTSTPEAEPITAESLLEAYNKRTR